MTELQLAIDRLKETISAGNVLLAKLGRESFKEDFRVYLIKLAEKPKVPKFPSRFIVAKDTVLLDSFVIGLKKDGGILTEHEELPSDYLGRTAFTEYDIRQIIKGLQTLLGDSND